MFLGLAMMLGALLWARDVRRRAPALARSYRGPVVLGALGAAVFLAYLWLVTHGAPQG